MQLSCRNCGAAFEAKRSHAKWCGDRCRKQAQGAARKEAWPAGYSIVRMGGKASPPDVLAPVVGLPPGEAGSVEAATLLVLAEAGREGSPAGAAALVLARRLDWPGADTGSAVAAVVRELRATVEVALAGVAVADDPVDELRARRVRRVAGG